MQLSSSTAAAAASDPGAGTEASTTPDDSSSRERRALRLPPAPLGLAAAARPDQAANGSQVATTAAAAESAAIRSMDTAVEPVDARAFAGVQPPKRRSTSAERSDGPGGAPAAAAAVDVDVPASPPRATTGGALLTTHTPCSGCNWFLRLDRKKIWHDVLLTHNRNPCWLTPDHPKRKEVGQGTVNGVI